LGTARSLCMDHPDIPLKHMGPKVTVLHLDTVSLEWLRAMDPSIHSMHPNSQRSRPPRPVASSARPWSTRARVSAPIVADTS